MVSKYLNFKMDCYFLARKKEIHFGSQGFQ